MVKENASVGRNEGLVFLFAISFLSLFLELLLIRWIGVEIRIFAYFRNLTLIACFLGLGIGFSLKRFRLGLLFSLLFALALAAAIHPQAELFGVSLRKIPSYLSFPDYNIWYSSVESSLFKIVLGYTLVAAVVIVLAGVFVPFGQILGDIFAASEHRIRDYSINLMGSLAGIWVFSWLSYLQTPPWIWFLIGAGGMALLIRPWSLRTLGGFGALLLILLFTLERDPPGRLTFWSPYQKLDLYQEVYRGQGADIPYYRININSVTYMFLLDLSPAQLQRFPNVFRQADAPYYPYDLPYRFQEHPNRVLIVGAGGGNDAAAALRNGAAEVDAVEIDPLIARLGAAYHPEQPYSDPRVRLLIDDARSFFKKTDRRYDLIVFARLDSHTLTSNFTNINLDSYVYTRESLAEAKGLLAQGGVIALSFFVPRDREWLAEKLYALAREVFGEQLLVIHDRRPMPVIGASGLSILCGELKNLQGHLRENPELARYLAGQIVPSADFDKQLHQVEVNFPTDDWPYLYLKKPGIPAFYYFLVAVLGGIMLLSVRFLFPAGRIGPSHFLFLGAGFMLVEVHSISKAALLFGSTWIVNVVIISAILVMILLANLIALRGQLEKMRWWYLGLLASLCLSYLVPVDKLFLGSYLTRGILVGAFYSLPLFFAGVIFASSIRRVKGVEAAFAANLLGATVGGMVESVSYLYGLRAVVLIALFLYAASAWALGRLPLLEQAAGKKQ